MKFKTPICFFLFLFCIVHCIASVAFASQIEPVQGLRDNTPRVHALTNARIVISPDSIVESGTVVIRDGIIVAAGPEVTPPADARIWDCSGLTVYPGLIDLYTGFGLPGKTTKEKESSDSNGEQPTLRRGPHHWNPKVHPEVSVLQQFLPTDADKEKFRELGFTTVLVVPPDGIFRGSSALVNLSDGSPSKQILRQEVAQHIGFDRYSRFSEDSGYPDSLLGAIALIRQTILDARWYQEAQSAYKKNASLERPEENRSLAALEFSAFGKMPVVMEVENEKAFLQAARIADEFKLRMWIRGSGTEYRRLDTIAKTQIPVILPLSFPEAPAVNTPEEELSVELADLQHWDLAPGNARRLKEAGVPFALTTSELKDIKDFYPNLRAAMERGLSREDALAALTTVPSQLLGMQDRLGTIAKGKIANLVVANGDLFEKETSVLSLWIDGDHYEIKKLPSFDIRGNWKVAFPEDQFMMELSGKLEEPTGKITKGEESSDISILTLDEDQLVLVFSREVPGRDGAIRLQGTVSEDAMSGTGVRGDGTVFVWSARRTEPWKREEKKEEPDESAVATLSFPQGGYGRLSEPEQPQDLLIRGATIWTSGPAGVLENADLLIHAGKIVNVDINIKPPAGAVIVDGDGKHVTPGLIDAHSHAASLSTNESGQAVTAEVRIQDVIDFDDINIYRQLAGGLTTANVLHGSANPIGGQNQVIKLRWGLLPEGLAFEGAIPGIKFALGENVKQSNWGDEFVTRYPQTRMGVEQIIRDRFQAALDYERAWQDYDAGKKSESLVPPRRDLELDALLEILRGKRVVHSHSYRQDEILMLVRIAEDFGFTIATFQHVLEGYKIAEALAQHGAGASCFSDWWAYKFEVYDAIPYNGTLMHNAGVLVSFNSDSDELARRMNTEASKAVKYGGLSEEEALKFVTINPAKQLRVDHRVGSLEPGKDADFVIWSGSPLSTYTICEQTWIDGRKYFDRGSDLKMREEAETERRRIVQKILLTEQAKKKDENESGKDAEVR